MNALSHARGDVFTPDRVFWLGPSWCWPHLGGLFISLAVDFFYPPLLVFFSQLLFSTIFSKYLLNNFDSSRRIKADRINPSHSATASRASHSFYIFYDGVIFGNNACTSFFPAASRPDSTTHHTKLLHNYFLQL